MNVVWLLTALYFGVFAVWGYCTLGRRSSLKSKSAGQMVQRATHHATAAQIAVGTSHCGAGCMIADTFCEFEIASLGLTFLGSRLSAEYAIDFAAAWLLGIAFQYFAIKPMEKITVGQAIIAAIKADTLSIAAFQVGTYAWTALVYYRLFPSPHLTAFQPRFCLMMPIGMICGYATSHPMNWFLIRVGLKEAM